MSWIKMQSNHILKKVLEDSDNYNGVVSHLKPDMLECEAKGALGSIVTNQASGGDGIPAELFQILKVDSVKVLHSICLTLYTLLIHSFHLIIKDMKHFSKFLYVNSNITSLPFSHLLH